MNDLKSLTEFLANAKAEGLRLLPKQSIQSLYGLNSYSSFEDLKEENEIKFRFDSSEGYNADLLYILDRDKRLLWYRLFDTYLWMLLLVAMLVYPLIISNFWLYLLLVLVPVVSFSRNWKTGWIVIVLSAAYFVNTENFEAYGMVILFMLVRIVKATARNIFEKEIVNSARRDELAFKWLYARGSIKLVNKNSGSLIYMI